MIGLWRSALGRLIVGLDASVGFSLAFSAVLPLVVPSVPPWAVPSPGPSAVVLVPSCPSLEGELSVLTCPPFKCSVSFLSAKIDTPYS